MRYEASFYSDITPGSSTSAEVIQPIVAGMLQLRKVCDVGGGIGAWLVPFARTGCEVLCIDGPWVDPAKLLVPRECFRAADLTRGIPDLPSDFDLMLCLEVAEHLPRSQAPLLVRALTRAAPAVLFSAALPGQGGTHHVNERPFSFWRELFEREGFVYLDPIRRRVWQDPRVEGWYQQNIRLFASADLVATNAELKEEADLALHEFPNLYSDYLLGDPSSSVRRLIRFGHRQVETIRRHRSRRIV